MMSNRKKLAFAGFRRGGSSIGFEIVQRLLIDSGLRCADPVKQLYDSGVATKDIVNNMLKSEWERNDIVGCFRATPNLSKKALSKIPLFLLVRDPRDCQISWSHARFLHQGDAVGSEIIINAELHEIMNVEDHFTEEVTGLLNWCENSGGCTYRYEDMIEDPLNFINAFQDFSGLSFSRHAIDSALIRAEFLQGAAILDHHHRSGLPYEALRVLPEPALDKLNGRFSLLIERLGYPFTQAGLLTSDYSNLIQRDAMKRYVLGLATQNGYRIAEIKRLKNEIAALREKIEKLGQMSRG